MQIDNINVQLDKQLYEDILHNYDGNIMAFKHQNSGLVINSVKALSEFEILKFITNLVEVEDGEVIDRNFINKHFKGMYLYNNLKCLLEE